MPPDENPLEPRPRSVQDQRWQALLDRLDVEAMTERFVAQVTRRPEYGPQALTEPELRRVSSPIFAAMVHSLKVGEDDADATATTLALATELGTYRAQAGVSLEYLMAAIRLDFSVLWDALLEVGTPADARVMVAHTAQVWDVVDSFAARTRTTYLAEAERLATEAASRREDYVSGIFAEDPPSSEALRRLAARLDIPPAASLGVAAALGDDVPALRAVLRSGQLRGGEVLTHPVGGGIVAFWVLDDRPGGPLHTLVEQLRDVRCGLVEQVDGLGELRDHARLAQDLAALLTPDDTLALTIGTAWPRIARDRLARAGVPTATDVTKALAACPEAERERVVEAVRTYLLTGSVAETAELVFSHRNTVMKRMRRFRAVTGVDVTVPVQAARLVVAWGLTPIHRPESPG